MKSKPQREINKSASKVVSALIRLGFYDFRLRRYDDHCEINILEYILSPYSNIEIYGDIIHYFIENRLQFEGTPKSSISTIMKEIQNK